ncbi:hypothetical protein [Proteus hauseri]
MLLKHDISKLKKMGVMERKIEAMRQLKSSYDQANKNNTLSLRAAKIR